MLLDQVNKPEDIKSMSLIQLEELAHEIRQFLIEKLSVTGGHLAPNLGVVELTLALHYLLDSPRDKLIFDVGHQSYVHKILTGRKDRFDTLRKYEGLCGFVKRSESEHDVWEAGHSSTSLSAAMGMAMARDFKGEDHKVVAIIGDAAIASGMAFEALNHIGHSKGNLMVILNDNEMSIAPNVGAMHNYLSKIRSDKHYLKMKEEAEHLIKKIPAIGGKLAKMGERIKDCLKYMLVSGVIFEELGFTYCGPVDGHNMELLLETLKQASKVQGPVIVHVITVKGKGYPPAEADSHTWHGLGPYKMESGKVLKLAGPPMYTEVFGQTLSALAREDNRIVAITPAMPGGSGLMKFAAEFPGRMIDVGIAEQHAATLCAALALEGMKPVFAIYSTFMQRSYDQIIHDICRHNANVIFAIDRAGFVGPDGETHQGVYDIAFLRHIPNMVLMMPRNENELQHMLTTAIDYTSGPIAVRYPRIPGRGVIMDERDQWTPIPIGSWEIIKEGKDLVMLAVGPSMIEIAEDAAEKLLVQGISVKVVNARFIKPLDKTMLLELAKLEDVSILTLEEGSLLGGFGSSVLEFYAEQGIYGMQVRNLAIPDVFVEHGSIKEQLAEVGLTVDRIVSEVQAMTPRRKQRA
ncbi:MAG: 1-deoxy-D-xylulose-5-phosphate synthase [Paenibacillaceae bacterium]